MGNESQTTDDEETCKACGGTGWNPAIKTEPVDTSAPVHSLRGLETIMAYVRRRLCCPGCDGEGKVKVCHG
jgi:DnaJ-class molecular chaperone